ncbi:hypothetical protein [Swaminathania salitolerans]|uniref:YMGG-like Gly-zipper domain-containing protein n=1 Tax=Swaminathania salitolerans TaxID=182838 RepID=A0A511BS81_9PROT|nr:hypothetical protein [Swaminathania salitolerans]GBQ12863.1 hypothetical protein AA21291_1323 [Swaminathania salitolerans LMG 21291]GEL03191.1 hypothetical protein SSA02_23540 [Swaminathania salitolerans]
MTTYPVSSSRRTMRFGTLLGAAGICALLSGCGSPYDSGARAGSGALIGGGAGAAIGALAGGGRGAAIGALAGGALGAAGGAATTPNRPRNTQGGYYNQQPGYPNGYNNQNGYNNGYAQPNYPPPQGYGYGNGY